VDFGSFYALNTLVIPQNCGKLCGNCAKVRSFPQDKHPKKTLKMPVLLPFSNPFFVIFGILVFVIDIKILPPARNGHQIYYTI